MKPNKINGKYNWISRFKCVSFCVLIISANSYASFIPLPDDIKLDAPNLKGEPIDLEETDIDYSTNKEVTPQIPGNLSVTAKNAQISFEQKTQQVSYKSKDTPIQLISDKGLDIKAQYIALDNAAKEASMLDNITIHHGNMLTRAAEGSYNWGNENASFYGIRSKINGIILRAKRANYATDENGVQYITMHDAQLSTHDVESPKSWLGFKKITVYPGDHGRLEGMSLGSENHSMRVPVLGWVPLYHSLNPKEGYLPSAGSSNIWGAYLRNNYGFLIGNRRVENGQPTSNYILTAKVDYRSSRGIGVGLDIETVKKVELYPNMTGLSLYYADDTDPQHNPTNLPRTIIDEERYRIALQDMIQLQKLSNVQSEWRLKANINILSDEYLLRDFYESQSSTNDKPSNTVSLVRRSKKSEQILLTRFTPNDFYSADDRAEWSYYRVRSALANSGINYETRNSAGIIKQNIPIDQRIEYKNALAMTTDPALQAYYRRLLNEADYSRLASSHEFSSAFKIKDFINITPKAGFGYTGYYGLDNVRDDTRFNAYLSCDINIKMHRKYSSVQSDWLSIDGITHTMQPYGTISYNQMSSSDPLVPQINGWSSSLSTNNPMPLDLMSFTGPDSWGDWGIWRTGLQNTIRTSYDGESRTLLRWNGFFDINLEDSDSNTNTSNLYSVLYFTPIERITLTSETQFPIIGEGDGFTELNHNIEYQLTRWLEVGIGHRYLSGHSIQEDASQINASLGLRISENYSFNARWYFDTEINSIPIQQYSVFRNAGAWQIGASFFLRDNGGNKETGFGISFSLSETGTAMPINF